MEMEYAKFLTIAEELIKDYKLGKIEFNERDYYIKQVDARIIVSIEKDGRVHVECTEIPRGDCTFYTRCLNPQYLAKVFLALSSISDLPK